jgi:hypothetical protein
MPLASLKVGSWDATHSASRSEARFLIVDERVYGDAGSPAAGDVRGNVNPIGPRGVTDEAKRYAGR